MNYLLVIKLLIVNSGVIYYCAKSAVVQPRFTTMQKIQNDQNFEILCNTPNRHIYDIAQLVFEILRETLAKLLVIAKTSYCNYLYTIL